MGRYQRMQKGVVLKAIENSGGITLTVAKRLGCAYDTAGVLIDRWEETRKAFRLEREKIKDIGEGHLFKAVGNGDIATIKWFLDRLGKDRGYGADPIALMADEPLKIDFTGSVDRDTMEANPDIEISDDKEKGTADK